MGFLADQIGPRSKNNRFYLSNFDAMGFRTITALMSPTIVAIPANPLNIFLETNELMYATDPFTFKITKEKSYSNVNYKELATTMARYANHVNFMFGFGYDETTKKFTFEYPINASLNKITIVLSTDLAERLGFGLTADITSLTNTGKKVEDVFDVDTVESKA